MLGDGSPFDLEATGHDAAAPPDSVGILLVHGFTGSPFEMRFLGERLSQRGFRALGIVLPGHGTSPRDLARTRWTDWYGAVESGVDTLRASCDHVAVVGQSLGGLLTLHLASRRGRQLCAVASLAAPLWLSGMARAVIRLTHPSRGIGRLLTRLVPIVPKVGGTDTRDPRMAEQNPCYRRVPVRALHQVVEFMELVRSELETIEIPTLVMHARDDHTAPFACSHEIAARVLDGRHHALSESYHNIAIDVERELVADTVARFIHTQLAALSHDPSASTPSSDPKEAPGI